MPKTKSAPAKQAVANLRLEKNPSICLVYDVYDSRGKAVAPKQVYDEYLLEERTSWRRRSMRDAVGPKVCADGDTWINILWPFSAVFGHQKTFFDVIQENYRTTDVAYPGDTFKQMLIEKDYRGPIGSASLISSFFPAAVMTSSAEALWRSCCAGRQTAAGRPIPSGIFFCRC